MHPVIKISAYKHYINKETGRPQPGCLPYDTDLYTELYRIKDGYYQHIIDTLRGMDDKDERTKFKATQLPSITVSAVTHTWRKIENLVNHTGLLCIDIDATNNEWITDWSEIRDKLFNINKNIVASFISASGNGCSFIIKINHDKHLDVFNSVQMELEKHLNIKIDRVCKDIVRLRFVSYDPDIKIRDNFDELINIEVSNDYKIYLANKFKYKGNILPAGKPDSLANFKNAILLTEAEGRQFVQGEKHWYLVALAGRCNATGMSEDYCKMMVQKHFSNKTNISLSRLLQPISNVYDTYKSQHGSIELHGGVKVNTKVLRWFISKFDKELLRSTFHLFGRKIITGRTSYHIKVDSPLLAYAMWLVSPEYTWTTLDGYDQYMSKETCAKIFPKNHYLKVEGDKRLWVKRL